MAIDLDKVIAKPDAQHILPPRLSYMRRMSLNAVGGFDKVIAMFDALYLDTSAPAWPFDQPNARIADTEPASLLHPWMPSLATDLIGIELHSATAAAFTLLTPSPGTSGRWLVYTDGSGGASAAKTNPDHCVPSWAFAVLWQDDDDGIHFWGALAGRTCFDEKDPFFIGAATQNGTEALASELSAIVWATSWLLQAGLSGAIVEVWVDNASALGTAFHNETPDAQRLLGYVAAELCTAAASKFQMIGNHIHGHCGHPFNELADTLCTHVGRSDCPQGLLLTLDRCSGLPPLASILQATDPPRAAAWNIAVAARMPDDGQWPHSLVTHGVIEPAAPFFRVPTSMLADDLWPAPIPKRPVLSDFRFSVLTYNSLSLKSACALHAFVLQIGALRVAVAGVQETRRKAPPKCTENLSLRRSGQYTAFFAHVSPAGCGGVAIFITNELAPASRSTPRANKPILFNTGAAAVLHADPRLLLVAVSAGAVDMLMVAAHVPDSNRTEQKAWLAAATETIKSRAAGRTVVIMIDSNITHKPIFGVRPKPVVIVPRPLRTLRAQQPSRISSLMSG